MATKSQRVIELEKNLQQAKNDAMHARRAAIAFMSGKNLTQFGAASNFYSVCLILKNDETGRDLLQPTVVISDHTGAHTVHEIGDAYAMLQFEANKPLGQFASNEDHSKRDVCDEAYRYLLMRDRQQN